ncbi:MAG: IS1595 family transposase [Proteobacteria bacterium]|nr:IS1595 family transposase [Pseudomonadota bacterium]
MCDITNQIFHNENKARAFLEAQRWPDGPVCPFCGQLDSASKSTMKSKKGESVKGWYHCRDCRKRFTVRVGTLYERSHIPLHKWLYATHMLTASKKGISAHQLHRMLGITYKSAWFMCHRIREGMKETAPLGGGGKIVEADETYIGNVKRSRRQDVLVPGKGWVKRGGGTGTRFKIISLVERGGRARSVHVTALSAGVARDVLLRNVERKKTKLMTDETNIYKAVGKEFEPPFPR